MAPAVAAAAAPLAEAATVPGAAAVAKRPKTRKAPAAPARRAPARRSGVERATRSAAAQVLAPTRKASASVAGLVWMTLGSVVALSLLLLVLQAAEAGPRLTEASDTVTGLLRRFVNPFGDAPMTRRGAPTPHAPLGTVNGRPIQGPVQPSTIQGPGLAAAARIAVTTSVNPHVVNP